MSEIDDGGLDDETLDHLCWKAVFERNDEWPPDETAEKCLEGRVLPDELPAEDEEDYELGYHTGLLTVADDFVNFLQVNGVAVEERAQRYARESDADLDVPVTAEELYTDGGQQ